jgi:hypothetical protein
VLPSIEVQHVQQDDGRCRGSVTNASSTSDTEEGSEPYEPPDILPDDVDDPLGQENSDRAASYHEKLAVPTIATGSFGPDKRAKYEPRGGDTQWDAHTAKRKLCETWKPKPKQLVNGVDCPVEVQRSQAENDERMKKRLKMESILH